MSTKRTFVLSLLLSLPPAATAVAQTPPCKAPITVGNVTYLGKESGNDRVKVTWTVGSGCMTPAGGLTVKVKVTRRLGHQDEGSVNVPPPGTATEATVVISRGTLETDPQSYVATITAGSAINSQGSGGNEGTLAELSAPGGKPFPEPAAPTNGCSLKADVTRLAYKGRAAGKDRVEVTWVAKSACVKPVDARLTATVFYQSSPSSPATVTFTHPASTATSNFNVSATTTLEVPVVGDSPIARIHVSLTETGRTTDTLSGTKSGSL